MVSDEARDRAIYQALKAADEVAAALVWLAGPDGAGVTGATIPVDGGLAL